MCVYVCLQKYLLENARSYESTSGVEGPGATHIQVSLVDRLQDSQEVSTLHLDGEREREREQYEKNR